ncbi:MAG: ABC transporter permease [Candidatus Acetothermia bacterium]|jgi:peptide/nickel transport system permease protein|nr:ABC transporter permease [Candidatus Acetothermia bacterium]
MKQFFSSRAVRRFTRNHLALVGLFFVAAVGLTALLADVIAPYDPLAMDFDALLSPPSATHPMGTDVLGRDLLSRVLYGSRYALLIGMGVVVLQMVLGGILGLVAGFVGGVVDSLIMRAVDIVWSIPGLVLALALAGALGGGIGVMIIAIAVTGWGQFTRLLRGQVLSLRELDYVTAAYALGASRTRILFRHVLPNALGPVVVYTTLEMPAAILSSAALSFLGVGAQPPIPEWGALIADGRGLIGFAWWVSTFPGLAIMITALGFNFVGDGLRDVLDPRFERRI